MTLNFYQVKTLHVYINYNGSCADAFAHYAKLFNTTISESHTYGDIPPSAEMPDIGDAHRQRIMHCSLPINEHVTIMGSDVTGVSCRNFRQGNNYAISLHVENKKEANRIFAGLSENGKAIMPMAKTFWNAYWGMCIDKFGVQWMVSAPL